jgi:spermidine/putrescine transport system permease protein
MASRRRIDPLLLYAIAFLIFIYVPVLLLPLFSFNDSPYVAFPLKDFTLRWYEQMIAAEQLQRSLMNSVKVGVIVAVVSTGLGMLAALSFTRYRIFGRAALNGIILVPLVIPSIILGVSILVILRQFLDIPLSLWTIGAGHVLICTPFSMLVLVSRLEGFDRSLEEASLDLGENRFQTFWRVTLPLALPGVVSSLLISFTTSFDEYVIASFLASSESTLPMYMWSQLRFPQRLPEVLALGSCILGVSFVVIAFAEWYRRRDLQPARA